MNRIIIALAATTAIAAAAPAAAQYSQYGGNIQLRTNQLQAQLQAGVQNGSITRAEAMPLRDQLRQLTRLERQYSLDGLSMQERSDLQNRMASLRQGIRMAARNGDDRYDRYDRDDRYGEARYGRDCPPGLAKKDNGCLPPGQVGRDDRDGRWGDDRWSSREMIDRDRRVDGREWRMAEERYGDSGRYEGRYDRDDDRHDRDDRYDDRGTRRPGLGGVLDSVLGRDTLRVGQRASGNLGSVPYELRNQYRDGNGVYYRADGRSIYQIDARSDTVLRIYALNR